jgi:hypothetical protein
MEDRAEDLSMMFLRGTGRLLASREIALALAEMLIKDYYGEDEFQAQKPLQIAETPDSGIIEGSREPDFESTKSGQSADGEITIEILKINCQVIKLIKTGYFPPL